MVAPLRRNQQAADRVRPELVEASVRCTYSRRATPRDVYTFTVSFGKEVLLSDVRYSAWANHVILEACAALTAEEIERDLRISHSSILGTVGHIYDGERVWLDCLRTTVDGGRWRLPQGAAPEFSFDALRQYWPGLSEGYRLWLVNLSEAELAVEVIVQLPGEVEPSLARWKILRHVLEHSTLHRGQIIGMIRMLGHTPPAIHRMDFYLAGNLLLVSPTY